MRLVVFKWGHDCAHYNDDQCCGQWKSMTDAQEMSVKLTLEVVNVKLLRIKQHMRDLLG